MSFLSGAAHGSQTPRVQSLPGFASTEAGREAVELAALAGLVLDPWQAHVLEFACAEKTAGKWAAFEVGLVVPRQNGKGSVLEARELAGLFLFSERMITHSAHQFDTSQEHFRRLLSLIEETPEFDRRVKRVVRSHGEEGIELKGGQRIRFRTRTKGGGRGFSGDLVVLDEAMILPDTAMGALMPTLAAKSVSGNPQLWYAGSAVDQMVHEHGMALARVRDRALKGDDPSLAYFEWSVDAATPDDVTMAMAIDPKEQARANPGLGIRISVEHVANEQRSLDPRTYAVERLNAGDWPSPDQNQSIISLDTWRALRDAESFMTGRMVFAFDISPFREWTTIAACGPRPDGSAHIEVVERQKGTGWVLDRLAELVEQHQPIAVVYDDIGPAGSLIQEATKVGCKTVGVNGGEYAEACGMFFDAVDQQNLRHLGTTELEHAVRGAAIRPLGDRWAWGRKSSTVDITPLVAVTLAHWGLGTLKGKTRPMVAFT